LVGDLVASMLLEGTEGLRELCADAGGLVHLAASGETSWHGFASATVELFGITPALWQNALSPMRRQVQAGDAYAAIKAATLH
jgi:hypothetical protein